VVLLSGGLDSTTMLANVAAMEYEVHALTFRYGQRHEQEIDLARRNAEHYRVTSHRIVDIDLRAFGGSSLTSLSESVPKDRGEADMATGIPSTYVPARNTIFLAFALAAAETAGAAEIFIGVNAIDYSGYPDCRPDFIAAFEKLAAMATRSGVAGTLRVRIRAPLMDMTKGEIITWGLAHDVDYSRTLSCYDPSPEGAACGRCDSCQLRLRGFAEASAEDPASYEPERSHAG
jgi:7-cyano-7-deazaguanine synthase